MDGILLSYKQLIFLSDKVFGSQVYLLIKTFHDLTETAPDFFESL